MKTRLSQSRDLAALSRRAWLKGAAASLVAAPFVSLLGGPARAAAPAGPKRLLIFYTPNGTIPQKYWPTTDGDAWSFAPGSAYEPLAPIQNNLLFLKGLDFYGASNHEGGMAAMLTGGGGDSSATAGKSIDQVLAPHLSAGQRFPSLELGAWTSPWGGSVQTRMVYSGPGDFVTPDDNPASVHARMFGDLSASASEKAALAKRRQRVLDLTRVELADLRQRLGTEERIKLDAHLHAIDDVESALFAPAGACEPPPLPASMNLSDYTNFPAIAKAQIDLGVLALACAMTSVVSIQLTHTVSPVAFSWLGINDGHHTLSHSADADTSGVDKFIACQRWFAEQFLYLVGKLAQSPDPLTGGALLDDTVVLWATELGDARLHVCTDVPFILAGPGGGKFKPGRFLDFGGAHHTRLLVSIAQAFGLPLEEFGNPNAQQGPLEGLS
jgi:hypothetical protein